MCKFRGDWYSMFLKTIEIVKMLEWYPVSLLTFPINVHIDINIKSCLLQLYFLYLLSESFKHFKTKYFLNASNHKSSVKVNKYFLFILPFAVIQVFFTFTHFHTIIKKCHFHVKMRITKLKNKYRITCTQVTCTRTSLLVRLYIFKFW